MSQPNVKDKRSSYHHGNLRQSLLNSAMEILEQRGSSALSMRSLADRVGVSRSALYHHFRNKDDLLAALAEQGFNHLNSLIENQDSQALATRDRVLNAVSGYLKFATEHAAQYDLMFGQKLWMTETETPFQRHAKDCFRHYVTLFESLQSKHEISHSEPPLRLAQIIWASLHGLAKLMNDDILTAKQDRDVLAQHLVNRFI